MTNTLAAIVYDATAGAETDQLLMALVVRLHTQDLRIAGTVQRTFDRTDRCACDMIVRNVWTGEETRISEDRGADARGCRLDPRSLEALVGATDAAVSEGIDVLVLNKFGKQEALGRGFRDVIGRALALEIPTVIGVNRTYLDAWRAFAGEFGDELSPSLDQVLSWVKTHLPEGKKVETDVRSEFVRAHTTSERA